jgi:hypothetical protein
MTLPARPKSSHRRTLTLIAVAVAAGAAAWAFFADRSGSGSAAAAERKLENIPFNGQRAYDSLKQLCAIGPRPSGSPGMEKQQRLLAGHFQKLGGQVEFQRFRVRLPRHESEVPMANILVHWHPEKTERILLCAHYDTLPYPLLDPINPRGRFVGANDNAGGVAMLMELAYDIPKINTRYGVDFLLLDGEEYVFDERRDTFFLGSQYFAEEYVKNPPRHRYRWGVLLDMVSDADLQLYQERNSVQWRDTKPLVDEIWAVAARLGVREFIAQPKHEIRDDHLMLHDVGHIPCIDIIDFDYAPWHTQEDLPDRCSPLSMAKVGWVIEEWLKTTK